MTVQCSQPPQAHGQGQKSEAGGGEESRGEQTRCWPQRQEAAGTPLPGGQVQDSGLEDARGVVLCRLALLQHWSWGPRRARGVCMPPPPPSSATLSVPELVQAAQPVLWTFGDLGPFCLYSSGVLGFPHTVNQVPVQCIPLTDDRLF